MALNASDPASMGLKTPGIEAVFITNHNPDEHEDMHDGIPYKFPPGEQVYVPLRAAIHMFAYKQDDPARMSAVARVSKDKTIFTDPATNKTSSAGSMAEGLRWLDNFEFSEGEFVPKAKAKAGQPGKKAVAVDDDLESLK